MRLFPYCLTVCFMALLLHTLPTLVSSSPIQLSPRTQVCSNARNTLAGTMFDRRDFLPHGVPHLLPRSVRSLNTVWCVAGTRTYLQLRITTTLASNVVFPVLSDAYNSVYAHLRLSGDGLVAAGGFTFTVNRMVVNIWNTNNHQVTWGVLGNTLWGLRKSMETHGVWGNAMFQVYDGNNLVGKGFLSLAPPEG